MKRKRLVFYLKFLVFIILLTATLSVFVIKKKSPEMEISLQKVVERPKVVTAKSYSPHEISHFFSTVDASADKKLTRKEVSWAIKRTMSKHMARAIRENMKLFIHTNKIIGNGLISWDEWFKTYSQKWSESDKETRVYKEAIAAAKSSWKEAARSNPDSLNIDEYLSFTHPEFSHPLIIQESKDLIEALDTDKDGMLNLEEYLGRSLDDERVVRKVTFEICDIDKNKLLSNSELLPSYDPKSDVFALKEAERLFYFLDANKDDFIDLDEFDVNLFEAASPQQMFHSIF